MRFFLFALPQTDLLFPSVSPTVKNTGRKHSNEYWRKHSNEYFACVTKNGLSEKYFTFGECIIHIHFDRLSRATVLQVHNWLATVPLIYHTKCCILRFQGAFSCLFANNRFLIPVHTLHKRQIQYVNRLLQPRTNPIVSDSIQIHSFLNPLQQERLTHSHAVLATGCTGTIVTTRDCTNATLILSHHYMYRSYGQLTFYCLLFPRTFRHRRCATTRHLSFQFVTTLVHYAKS